MQQMMPKLSACILLLDRQPHGVECRSLCGSEVTWKIKQLEVEGPIAGDANALAHLK